MRGCMPNFGDWGNYHSYKDYTFNATATGSYTMFTVTGDVLFRVLAVCTTTIVTVDNDGTCSLGIAGNVGFIIPATVGDALVAREIWHDAAPDSEIENLSVARSVVISDGNDIILNLLVDVFTSGALRFYYAWMPLSNDAQVVPT